MEGAKDVGTVDMKGDSRLSHPDHPAVVARHR